MTKIDEISGYIQDVVGDVNPFGEPRDAFEIFLEDDFPEPKFSLSVGGIGTLPLGDIAAIKAKSKNGKTYLATILAAAIYGANIFDMESRVRGSTILYFDTEQNERNTARILVRLHHLTGNDPKHSISQLRTFSLRKMNTLDRWTYIVEQVQRRSPSVVIIDGVADLILDFNDIKESEAIISKLMKLSAENDCSIICVLHTNKAKDDNNMKGHLGTLLVQKAADVYEVVKDGSTFTVKETECRNVPIADFSFVLDYDGMPQPATAPIPFRKQERLDETSKILQKVFENEAVLTYNNLVRKFMTHGTCSDSTAKRRVKEAVDNSYIEPTDEGAYRLTLARSGG